MKVVDTVTPPDRWSDSSPRRRGGPTKITASLAFVLVLASAVAVVGFLFMKKADEHRAASSCENALRTIGGMYQRDILGRGAPPKSGGVPYLIELVLSDAGGRAHVDSILRCPSDDAIVRPVSIAQVREAGSVSQFRSVCSYAVRDFERYPLSPEAIGSEIIAADSCDNHRGVNVLYNDGTVRRLRMPRSSNRKQTPVVGPNAALEELRVLCIDPEE